MTKQTEPTRDDRLADALRANLRRRKDQARARKITEKTTDQTDTLDVSSQTLPHKDQD